MKFFLISDNNDTLVGMRLAGVEGVVARDAADAEKALLEAVEDNDTAILLITEKLVKLLGNLVYDMKLTRRRPLIVEIPGRGATSTINEHIAEYIQSAIGFKL